MTDRNLTDRDILPALARLPDRQREAARLVWVDDLTQREAARRMGITQKSVTDLLQAAQQNLRYDVAASIPDAANAPRKGISNKLSKTS